MERSVVRCDKPSTHFDAHPDDIAVSFLLCLTGRAKKEDGLRCLFNPNSRTIDGNMAIGIQKSPLDEHSCGGTGKIEPSAFSKVIKQFDLERDEKIKRLERFINRTDSGGGKHPFDLSVLTQAIHRCNPGSSQEGVDWCWKAIEAVWNDPQYFAHTSQECGKFFEQAGSAWLLNRFGDKGVKGLYRPVLESNLKSFAQTLKEVKRTNDPALAKIAQFFREGCKGMLDYFALPRISYSEYKYFGMQTAFRLAGIALDAKYDGQVKFLEALDEIRELAATKLFGKFTALYIESENLEIQRAILYSRPDVAVTIRKNPNSGHVQIFSNSKTGVSLKELAAAIRLEELSLAEKLTNDFPQEELREAGNACGLEQWCFIVRHQDAKGAWIGSDMLLNGSESYPGVEPTKITKERIKELVGQCLSKQ